MRPLKEQCRYLHRFQSLAEVQRIIGEFIPRHNTGWLIERPGHQAPAAARMGLLAARPMKGVRTMTADTMKRLAILSPVVASAELTRKRVEVVETALEEALDLLRLSGTDIADRRRALEAELADLEQEIARYARAVAEVGPLASLLGELRQRETRRDHLSAQLRALAGATSVAALDPAHVRRDLRERLTDWQGLLRRETPQARQILREVLAGRLIFAPKIDGSARYYEFTGQATLSGVLAGVVTSDMMVTPAGFEPAISTLKGSRPWPG